MMNIFKFYLKKYFNFFFNMFCYLKNLKKIQKYKKKRINTKVIYTCISGKYDTLKNMYYIDESWDYICFTNRSDLLKYNKFGVWKIEKMRFEELDQIRNARWHKIFPNKIFGSIYEESLWIDGNINILSKKFFEKLQQKKYINFITAIHPERNCIYEEALICKKLKKDKENLINSQIDILKKEKYPKYNGLYETNIIYRKHDKKDIKKLMEDWWYFIVNYSRRDQLSLNYVCWKNNINCGIFNNWSYREKNKEIRIENHLLR